MRKLARLAVLAVLFAPTLASAQLSLGARLAYGLAMGEAAEGGDLADFAKSQIPIQLDVGYRVTPALTIGSYFAYGFANLGDDLECDDCSGRVYRLGVQLDYAFKGGSMTPWVGGGIGYEWLKLKDDATDDEITLSGFEYLNLQGGLDWKVADKFSVGPFALFSIAQYSKASEGGEDFDIDNKAMHQWLQLGIRGRFDL